MSKTREEMVRQALMIANRANEKHEKHQAAASRWYRWNFWTGTITLILSVFATSSTVPLYLGHILLEVIITSTLSLAVTILTAVLKLHNPADKGKLHEKANHSYNHLQKQANLFCSLEALDENFSESELRKKLDNLIEQEYQLDTNSITLPSWASKVLNQKT